jgi:uncharacterized membrane protein
MSKEKNWIDKYFSEGELKEIQLAAESVEQNTAGEIVLSFRNKKKFLEKLYSNHELAMKDFDVLGVANTKLRTGILVFIIFEEKYYDIIADEGIYSKIPDGTWNDLELILKEDFREGKYCEGVLMLINKMEKILTDEFPSRADSADDDEIDREIVIN